MTDSFAESLMPRQPRLCARKGCEQSGEPYTLKRGRRGESGVVYRCQEHKPRNLGGNPSSLGKARKRKRGIDVPGPLQYQPTGDSWANWRVAVQAINGLPLDDEELWVFKKFTQRDDAPTAPVKEAYFIVGRRGGKDVTAAGIIADYALRPLTFTLAPGEKPMIACIAADREQAGILFSYVKNHPRLAGKIKGKPSREKITLSNGITISIQTSSFRSVRGYTLICAVADEVAFWHNAETSTNPDREIFRAVRPGLLTSGGPLIVISSPYVQRGELWDAYKRSFGKDDPRVLVWQAQTLD